MFSLFRKIFNIKEKTHISDLNVSDKRFSVCVDYNYTAFIDYKLDEGKYTLLHCQVPEELRGLGVGQLLVKKTFKHIRKSAKDTTIRCSYIRSVTEKLNL